MTKSIGTNDLINSWAENGGVIEPDSGKVDVGWQSGERPNFQTMNWIQNLIFKQLNYLMRSGVPEWNADTTYIAGNMVVASGVPYIAINGNTNSVPPSADWSLLSPKNNLEGTAAPTVDDDAGEGYSAGSRWIDTVNSESYVLIDATVGAAVWQKTTLTIDELGALAFLDEVAFAQLAASAIANQAEAEAGTATNKLMTPERTKQFNDANLSPGIGIDQTWQDMSASRDKAIEYTNSTGKPIMVSIEFGNDQHVKTLTVDGLDIAVVQGFLSGSSSVNSYLKAPLTAIIPNGSTYEVNSTSAVVAWHELR